MQSQQAYLDNNIVSAIAKDDTPAESDALDDLIEAHERGLVRLITSVLTLEEIRKYSGVGRRQAERTFRLLEKIPVVRWDEICGFTCHGDARTWITSPLFRNDPLYDRLLKMGLETMDARHVFVCAKNGCPILLTCDGGILSRGAEIQHACGVAPQKPSNFLVSLAIR